MACQSHPTTWMDLLGTQCYFGALKRTALNRVEVHNDEHEVPFWRVSLIAPHKVVIEVQLRRSSRARLAAHRQDAAPWASLRLNGCPI